ncbi:MAG: histidine kinase [Saprospiraceae bacterium]|nr:histidine kinase [Saprospiraceae bacterium]
MAHRRQCWLYPLLAATWLMGITAVCLAQQPFSRKYTVADGLLYPEAFVHFDGEGNAWVNYSGADKLSRFDGVNWEHFDLVALGLPPALLYSTHNEHGTWFQARSENGLSLACYTLGGKWKKYAAQTDVLTYVIDPKGYPHFMDRHAFTYSYDPASDSFRRSEMPVYVPQRGLEEKLSNYFFWKNEIVLVMEDTTEGQYLFRYGKGFQKRFALPASSFYTTFFEGDDIRGAYTQGGQVYFWQKGQSRPLQATLSDGRKGQVIGLLGFYGTPTVPPRLTAHVGVLVKNPLDGSLSVYAVDSLGHTQLLFNGLDKEFNNSGILLGPDGHWWYNTSSGIVRTDPALLTFNNATPNMVNGLHAINEDGQGRIWMGGYNGEGGFAVFDGKTLQKPEPPTNVPVLPGSWRSPEGKLFFYMNAPLGLSRIEGDRPVPVKLKGVAPPPLGFYFQSLKNGQLALGLYEAGLGIGEERHGEIHNLRIISKKKGMGLLNVLTITEDLGGRLWLGRFSQGIAIYDPVRDTAITWLRTAEHPKSFGTMSSCLADDGSLLLGGINGLYSLPDPHRFDYLRHSPFDFTEKIQLPGNDTSTIAFLKNLPDYLVAGSQFGVYLLDKKYKGKRPRIFTLQYGKDIAGGGSEQNAVLYTSPSGGKEGGFLWVGTQEGATRIDLAALQFDTSATTLRLTGFTAGGSEVPIAEGKISKLPTKKRNITFAFIPSGNKLLKDDLYFDIAVVNGRGDTLFWRSQTKERVGEMPYLPQGKYTLHITAFKHNVVSGEAAWAFNMPGLLSESPWFWVGLALVVLGIPFTWFYMKKRHQAELERSRRERDALQIRALSNFFNPHFINNALHWVQSRYRKDADTATIVGRLSENVDHLFANTQSGKAYHPLSKELEIVQNYLKIQQVRFGEGLRVSLDLPKDEGAMEAVQVPSMLLQIHTENAVEKGIRNRKEAGRFLLSVKMGDDGCHVAIEDDGRGRPRNVEPQFGGTRKGSTAVMDDLIALFNRYNKQPLTVRYEDFIFGETEGGRYGTRVHFFIPKNYNYELS